MPWVGVSHGADAPYIFNGHYTKGEVPLSDQNLAERISRGLITFACTGNPVSSTTSKKQFPAFPESMDVTTEAPESFYDELIRGLYGTGPAFLTRYNEAAEGEEEFPKRDSNQVFWRKIHSLERCNR